MQNDVIISEDATGMVWPIYGVTAVWPMDVPVLLQLIKYMFY